MRLNFVEIGVLLDPAVRNYVLTEVRTRDVLMVAGWRRKNSKGIRWFARMPFAISIPGVGRDDSRN